VIYYDDGSTYDGPPEDAPGLGVQVIVCQVDGQSKFVVGADFYCWHADDGQWWGADVFGLMDHLQQPGWKRVLFGRTISNADHGRIMARAMEDHGLIVGGLSQ
jgi:hypothetical protein